MSIRCGHCGRYHATVAEVRNCDGVPQEIVDEAIDGLKNLTDEDWSNLAKAADAWEGATESDPGVWSPGPAAYLDARRNPEPAPFEPGGFGGPTADELRQKQWDEMLKEISEGFYALSEDEIYMVVRSKAGRLYAKILVGTQSGGRWEYAAGAITKLKPNMRMDLDAAKKYGQETGTCLVCGRTLTNPDSIEAGIGPVCASRF